jgi:hypothetical protein
VIFYGQVQMRLVTKWFVWESEEKWQTVESFLLDLGLVLFGGKPQVFDAKDLNV